MQTRKTGTVMLLSEKTESKRQSQASLSDIKVVVKVTKGLNSYVPHNVISKICYGKINR